MEDDSGLGVLGGLILILVIIAVIIQIIIQIIIWIVTAIAIAVSILAVVAIGIALFIGAGVLANLTMRNLIGAWGDRQGEVTPRKVYFGLAFLFGAPIEFWLVVCEFTILGPRIGLSANEYSGFIALGLLFLSTPAYYAAWWAKEIPELHIKLEVPYRFDDTMRAEESILVARLRAWALVAWFQAHVGWKTFVLSTRQHLRVWYARGLGFLARSFYRIHLFFLTRSREV